MQDIKNAYHEYIDAEIELDEIDDLWENDPENAEIEMAWDAAYKKSSDAMANLADEIVRFTRGAISAKTARRMIVSKGEELAQLIARAA